TEIRKVPVTVLSRCQRFDLRRIEPEVMIDLLRRIAGREGAQISDDALALITRAAEGSARDATSLLDQAISHGAGETTADEVRAMLGLADRGRVMDLFEKIMRGDAPGALTELSQQYADGADPMAVLRDLAEITHWISVVKITPEAAEDPTIGPDERSRGLALAEGLGMRALTRMWQMLLKALDEVGQAPNAMMAAEMAVIRLTHVAELPSPEDLLRRLQESPPPSGPGGGGGGGGAQAQGGAAQAMGRASQPSHAAPAGPSALAGSAVLAVAADQALARYPSFDHVLELIRANRDVKLLVEVESGLRLAAYQPGRIEFTPADGAAPDLAQRLGSALQRFTGTRWGVSVVNGCTTPTVVEKRDAADLALKAEAEKHPLVLAALAVFPKARIVRIHTPEAEAQQAAEDALPEVEDEWDPFEE
ncbi:MAG TPA: DNA polymerase III subunit gamma/tau, partial [Citreicella sp.]|nr:DNA polymerase III subunit gamma/tau [Citreicella sp.]